MNEPVSLPSLEMTPMPKIRADLSALGREIGA
jgi:hypothetical protein